MKRGGAGAVARSAAAVAPSTPMSGSSTEASLPPQPQARAQQTSSGAARLMANGPTGSRGRRGGGGQLARRADRAAESQLLQIGLLQHRAAAREAAAEEQADARRHRPQP